MLLIGCLPAGRKTEQHDIFFAIGKDIRDVLPRAMASWPEGKKSFHLDAWREVSVVDNHRVRVTDSSVSQNTNRLFFINLGGYKPGEFDEFHYRTLVVAPGIAQAIRHAKQTAFFKHTGFQGASAHVDDKYGIGVDEVFEVKDILPGEQSMHYQLSIETSPVPLSADPMHLGYFKPSKIEDWAPKQTDHLTDNSIQTGA